MSTPELTSEGIRAAADEVFLALLGDKFARPLLPENVQEFARCGIVLVAKSACWHKMAPHLEVGGTYVCVNATGQKLALQVWKGDRGVGCHSLNPDSVPHSHLKFDETPRAEIRRELLPEVEREIVRRDRPGGESA